MKRVLVSELAGKIGQKVVLQGWIYRIRELSSVTFLLVRDRTGIIQVAVDPVLLQDVRVSTESVVEVEGIVNAEPRARLGYEVVAERVRMISPVAGVPFNINTEELQLPLETILDHRVFSLRHAKISPIFKIQAALVHGFQSFLNQEGFLQVFSPKLVASGTEGGTELFEVCYFDETAYLAQSPQFYKQMLVGTGYERVYEVGHVYRAEKHATTRHLNEYVSLDLEMGFIEDEHDVMELENRLLAYMFAYVEEHCPNELATLGVNLPAVNSIPKIKLQDALELLGREYGKADQDADLDPEGERLLSRYFLEQEGSEFVFVTDYPWEKRPMYTMPKENSQTRSFDLLFRGLEITTGGQRIHQLDLLQGNMRKKGLAPEHFSSYLEVFALGMPPHGGLAIGLERLTAQILGVANIREVTLFPRDRNRLTP